MLGRQLSDHRSAEAFAVVQQAFTGLALVGEEPMSGAYVLSQPFLAWAPRVSAIAPVVEQQHPETLVRQRSGKGRPQAAVTGVAIGN